ncbi:hypothetical protein Xbud_03420 [Xenorhabdus budapestensis]|uniref:Uncharacterized protein n=1 Tax=Xenorhabdus budapestensis TaxID=290110 RepID=A0A2D0IQ30_XENBU|nr:hypothetical protein Xbud_03420 [Xenorhabdus budapestensis]
MDKFSFSEKELPTVFKALFLHVTPFSMNEKGHNPWCKKSSPIGSVG